MNFLISLSILILYGTFSCLGMELPENQLADQLEHQCTVSGRISRKRANSPVLDFTQTQQELFERINEKRAKRISELEENIKQGVIIPYRVAIAINDLNAFSQKSYVIRKTTILRPNENGLIPVELYIAADDEKKLLEDPMVKMYTRLQQLSKFITISS